MTVFVFNFADRLQANVVSTGLLGVQLLPLLQRTAAMQAPVEGVDLKPHLTIVASDSTSFSIHHSGLSFPILWARRVLTVPIQCTLEPALPSITTINPFLHSTTRRSLTRAIGTQRPSYLMCSSHGRSHICPKSQRVV